MPRVSELIADLQRLLKEEGDVPVFVGSMNNLYQIIAMDSHRQSVFNKYTHTMEGLVIILAGDRVPVTEFTNA